MTKKKKDRPERPERKRRRRRSRSRGTFKIKVDINNQGERRGRQITPVKCVPRAPGEPVWITAALATCCPACGETVQGEVIGHSKEINAWLHRECHPWTKKNGSRRSRKIIRAKIINDNEIEENELKEVKARIIEPKLLEDKKEDCDTKCMPTKPGKTFQVKLDPKILASRKDVIQTKCPFCRDIIDVRKDNFYTCAECYARHHDLCWFTKTKRDNEEGSCCVCGSLTYSVKDE